MSAKHRGKGPQAMTANILREGLNVWMTRDLTWSEDYAEVFTTEDADMIAQMEVRARQDEERNYVVGAYFIDVEAKTGLPVRYREKFRVSGPTHDLGETEPNKS